VKILRVLVKLGLKKEVWEGEEDSAINCGDRAILSMIFGRQKVLDGLSFNFWFEFDTGMKYSRSGLEGSFCLKKVWLGLLV